MSIRNIIQRGFDLWERLENSNISFRAFLVLFLCTATIRNLQEAFVSTGYVEQFSAYAFHYTLFYLIACLTLVILLSICSGERIEKVTKLMLFLWLLILLPPILDLILFTARTGERKAMGWIRIGEEGFWWTFFNFYNPFVTFKGSTLGIRLQSLLSCVLAAVYVYVKSRSVLRTLVTPLAVWFFSFCLFSLPAFFVFASSIVSPGVVGTGSMLMSDGHLIRNMTHVVNTTIGSYLLLVLCFLFLIWLLRFDARKLRATLFSLEWLGCGHFLLLSGLGFFAGWKILIPDIPLGDIFGNHKDLAALFGLVMSLWAVLLFRRSLPGVLGRRTGVGGRRGESGFDDGDVMLAALFLAVSFSLVTSYSLFMWILALIILETVSVLEPFRTNRVPIVGSAVRAGSALTCSIAGFTLFTGSMAPSLFPGELALLVFAVFFLVSIPWSMRGRVNERKLDILTGITTTAALLLAGMLLTGGEAILGMMIFALLFLAGFYLSGHRTLTGAGVYLLAFVFSIYSLSPVLDRLSRGNRRFPEEIRHSLFGTFLEVDGLEDHAMLEFEKAFLAGSPDPWVVMKLGFRSSLAGEKEKALRYYMRALELAPDNAEALNGTLILLSELGREIEAAGFIERLLGTGIDAGPFLGNVATFFIDRGNAGDGLRAFLEHKELLAMESGRSAVLRLLFGLLDSPAAGDLTTCLSNAEKYPDDSIAQLFAGAALQRSGNYREAALSYDRVLEEIPEFGALHFILGSVYQQAGNPEMAVSSYEHFLAEYPGNLEAGINLSAAWLDLGRTPEAERLLRGLASDFPEEPRVIVNLANVRLMKGDNEGAEKLLRDFLMTGREDPTIRFNLGVILERKGKSGEAVRHYMKAIEGGLGNPALFTKIGTFFEAKGDGQKALFLYRKALELDPGYGPALERIGKLEQDQ